MQDLSATNSSEQTPSRAEELSTAAMTAGATFSAHTPDTTSRVRGPVVQSHGVDSYLTWLAALDSERQRHTSAWKRVLPRAEKLAAGVATDGGTVTEEQVRIAERFAHDFASQSLPPTECKTLADLYGTSLAKSAAALRCVKQVGTRAQEPDENGMPYIAACADTGEAEMIQANTELQWIRQQFPGSKAKPFQLTF